MSNPLTMTGPCVVCGATNYSPSLGGPTICPRCDCGHKPTWAEVDALRAALVAAEVALADERRHADAGYRALDELATFTLEDFPNGDARHPNACVTPAYRNAAIAAVDVLADHAARRAAEVANG